MNVVILVRVSSKSDRQEYDRQISDLTAVAQRNGWNVVRVIKAKISATKTRLLFREDIAELYDIIETGKVEKVLITELTRLGRVAKEIRDVYEFLAENNISIFIQSLGLDTGAKGPFQKSINNIIVTILSELAELETVRLSQRIKSGLQEARKKGKHIGRPKGSKKDIEQEIKTNPKYKSAAKALKEGTSLRKTAAFAGISLATAQKIKRVISS